MQRSDQHHFEYFDFWLLGATLLLTLIGILMIYSATACITAEPLDWQSPAVRQALYAVVGVIAMVVLTFIDYRVYASLRWLIWAGTVALLATVSLIGIIRHGAERWIDLGVFVFQPSEVSKLALILVVAKYMADHAEQSQAFAFRGLAGTKPMPAANACEMTRWRHLLTSFVFVAVPLVLIYRQPDLGTTIVLAMTWGLMALAAGMKLRHGLVIAALLVVAAPLLWANLRPYQQERILTFINPERDPLGTGYNVEQARIAIGSGGWLGLGFCSGTQSQLRFLRIRQTDFIFSVIGEELGFIGALFVIGLIVFILLRLIRAAMLSRTTYGKLIAVGVTAVIWTQSFVNLGMNLGLLPVVGVPLPFVSAGGSALVSLLAAEGVVQSILLRHRGLQLEGASQKYE